MVLRHTRYNAPIGDHQRPVFRRRINGMIGHVMLRDDHQVSFEPMKSQLLSFERKARTSAVRRVAVQRLGTNKAIDSHDWNYLTHVTNAKAAKHSRLCVPRSSGARFVRQPTICSSGGRRNHPAGPKRFHGNRKNFDDNLSMTSKFKPTLISRSLDTRR